MSDWLLPYAAGIGSAFLIYLANKIIKDGVLSVGLRTLQVLPGGKALINKEQTKIQEKLRELLKISPDSPLATAPDYSSLPSKPLAQKELIALLESLRFSTQEAFDGGKAFGGIYSDLEEHHQILSKAYEVFSSTNALFPEIFPALRKFENEVVRMTINIVEGNNQVVGVMTTGGTESIILAIKAYRDRARDLKRINFPEIIVPNSAHPAFVKACHYLGVKAIFADCDKSFAVNVKDVRSKITRNTILIVGSAPSYPHGVIDPITELASLATERDIPLHVDACLGAFILPWLEKLGFIRKRWNFSVPGVTSMSADVHKYGLGPKGASVLMFIDRSYRDYQFFSTGYWSGGLYCSPSITGSRAGGIIAASWAGLLSMGQTGFEKSARDIQDAFQSIINGLQRISSITVLGPPDACCIAFVSDKVDILKVADVMDDKGWKNINRLQRPSCAQIQVGNKRKFDIEKWLSDLADSIDYVRDNPDKFKGKMAAIYGMAGQIPVDSDILQPILGTYLDVTYT
eukprot:TRINITY_DN4188_c0_g1_i1.p1 TRINITY_DN4188_c0_g1~~TRINITY_DN4188_c0_g1_i1.p1  ORF type:complete len:516 (-),score=75.37 TRINITY_DN4188_c0_g1_i1:142-1689(-)